MKTSESQTSLLKALFDAQGAFPVIPKTKKGQAGNRAFMYAPLENIRDLIQPVLRANGLLLTHSTDGHTLLTRLEHISGEWRECSMPVNAEHANMQSYGIEITYRRRYSLQLVLGIVTEEDTDGHGEGKETIDSATVAKIKAITSARELTALFKSMPEKERAPLVSTFSARRKELEAA
jgi:prophage tail gpP-like protein